MTHTRVFEMIVQIRNWGIFMSACGALLLISGCETGQEYSLTYKLWNNAGLAKWAEPAHDPHLALFTGLPAKDMLVQYDETVEGKETVCRRSYFLARNAERIAQRKRPYFVNPQTASAMVSIPIQIGYPGVTNGAPHGTALVGFCNNRAPEFWLVRDSRVEGPFQLPFYPDSNGNFTRVAITPFAVAGDTVMVGLVAGVVAGYMYAAGEAGCWHAQESH